MIETPDAFWNALGNGEDATAVPRVMACRVDSWRGAELLASELPVAGGRLEGDRSSPVPETVTLTLPIESNGTRLDPIDRDDPLAPYGQRLRVSVGLQTQDGTFSWLPRGEFLVLSTNRDGDQLTVQCANLLHMISEARLITPYQPAGETLGGVIRKLVEPAIPVVIDGGLTDRTAPTSLQFDDDRLAAVYEVADAWPAQVRMHSGGYLLVEPVPVLHEDEWVADSRPDTSREVAVTSRDGAVNCIVARGTAADGAQVQAVAYDREGSSPTYYTGPFNPLPVPQMFDSPLLTTVAQCRAAANSILARRKRAVTRRITLEIDPAPMFELGDLILVHDDRTGDFTGTIESQSLPLTADSGAHTVGLAVFEDA